MNSVRDSALAVGHNKTWKKILAQCRWGSNPKPLTQWLWLPCIHSVMPFYWLCPSALDKNPHVNDALYGMETIQATSNLMERKSTWHWLFRLAEYRAIFMSSNHGMHLDLAFWKYDSMCNMVKTLTWPPNVLIKTILHIPIQTTAVYFQYNLKVPQAALAHCGLWLSAFLMKWCFMDVFILS